MFLGKLWVRVKGEILSATQGREESIVRDESGGGDYANAEKKNSPKIEHPETEIVSNPRSLGD